jgi:redox-sensing transcriptional repressor
VTIESGHLVSPPDTPSAGADSVSDLTTQRLSVYLRCLDRLSAAGAAWVSSGDLAGTCRLNAAQIRRDLASFGAFGVRGVGYSVDGLRRRLREIMGLDRCRKVAIIGAGNLGQALADYGGFRGERFQAVALFDSDPSKIGTQSRAGVDVRHVDELPEVARREGIDIAIVAVPADAVPHVSEALAGSGIRAVLNFTPALLDVPQATKVTNVDLAVLLESLSFFLAREAHG